MMSFSIEWQVVALLILIVCAFDCFFFFQAEDGIRDRNVTGVQTCALRSRRLPVSLGEVAGQDRPEPGLLVEEPHSPHKIGRASCRESVDLGGRRIIKKKKRKNDSHT